jgi:hypothetical protein
MNSIIKTRRATRQEKIVTPGVYEVPVESTEVKKFIKDGCVAVLFSPDFGAGWYSWHGVKELLFDRQLVGMVMEGVTSETIELYCREVYGDHYYGGATLGLEIAWVPSGTEFMVEDYDGAETVTLKDEVNWIKA